jgi:HlyD family secretion protein
LGGTLDALAVQRGQAVTAGTTLFALEKEAEDAGLREAERRAEQAQARLDNLTKGKRPAEIAALEAQLEQARYALRLSEVEFARREQLYADAVIAIEELDQMRTQRDRDRARVDELLAELETARLGGRVDEIRAAQAEVEALTAVRARARWAVDQKTVTAPADGLVHDTFYRPGEWVAAGSPVVALLPPANVKVRFFIPQAALPAFAPGQAVTVRLDGAPQAYAATVNYVSTRTEYTPPVIYSRETRAKLVFRIEAVFAPELARDLRPGQPAEVRRQP